MKKRLMVGRTGKKLKLFHSVEVLFLEYFHTAENTSILWHWTNLWKLDFPTFFSTIQEVQISSDEGLTIRGISFHGA